MYSPAVLDHFQNPRNVGEVVSPSARAQVENPACGDIMLLTLKIAGGRITDARFRTKGCVASIACGSVLTELLLGRPLDEVRQLGPGQLVRALGGLNPESRHASHLAIDALSAALKGF